MILHPLDAAPFFERLGAGLVAGSLVWLVAIDYGSLLTRLLLPGGSAYQRFVLGAALGYALIGWSVGLLGLLHLVRPVWLTGLLLTAVVLRSGVHIRRTSKLRAAAHQYRKRMAELSWLQKCCIAAAFFAVAVGVIAAALPAVWWDPLAYHLPIVALTLKSAAFVFNPDIQQTGFPLLSEAAALPAYVLAGSAGAAMATLGAGIILALISGMVAESLMEGAGFLASLLVISSALWIWLAPSFYIDIPLALFSLAALASVLCTGADGPANPATPTPSGQTLSERQGLLSGAFAGAAAATKYNGLFVVPLVLLIAWERSRKQRAPSPTKLWIVASVAVGVFFIASGWYLRTYVSTGDPVYPFLSALIAHKHGAGSPAAVHTNPVAWVATVTPHFCGGGISPADALLLPVRLLTQPRSFCGDPGPALIVGFILFLSAPFVLRGARPWFAVAFVLTGVWFFSAQQWRFLVTALCIVAALAAAATRSLQPRVQSALSVLLVSLCVFGVAVNLSPAFIKAASNSIVPAFQYIIGRQSAHAYLRSRVDNFAAAEWLAAHDERAKVFALDDVRDYYFGLNVRWGNSPYPGGFRVDWTVSPQQRYALLVREGYRYMVVNDNPEYTHRTLVNIDWNALRSDEIAGVIQQVFSENGVSVYRLKRAAQHGRRE